MKIKGTCKRCGREFFFEQAIATGGRCPWDGEPFNADYAVVLIEAMRDAERAGTRLEQTLEDIAAMRPAFTVDAIVGAGEDAGRDRRAREEPHHAGVDDVGFNAMQPGKIKRGDLVFLIAAIVVIGALLAWAFFGS